MNQQRKHAKSGTEENKKGEQMCHNNLESEATSKNAEVVFGRSSD